MFMGGEKPEAVDRRFAGFRSRFAPGLSGAASPSVGGVWKRAFDVAGSAGALVFLSPLLLVLAVLVRVTSPGPSLFWSQRIGRGAEVFAMPKFRTMRIDAPVQARESIENADVLLTPIGAFLRTSSLDELPQLYCVLVGQMSLVGPRPLLVNDPAAHARLTRPSALVPRPGVTGLAQVRGRNRLSAQRKVRYDALYGARWSWRLDARILADTVKYVVLRKDVL